MASREPIRSAGTLTSGWVRCWRPRCFTSASPRSWYRCMATDPSYLRSTLDGSVVQYRDWGLPLGRRFRALRLWALLRLEGAEALRARLRRDLANAQRFASLVEAAPGWAVLAPVKLQTVCVLHTPAETGGATLLDKHTLAWCEAVNASGPGPRHAGHPGRPLDGPGLDRCRANRVGGRRGPVGIDAGKGGGHALNDPDPTPRAESSSSSLGQVFEDDLTGIRAPASGGD